MSRTKRYIPDWARGIRPYELTWVGLGHYTLDSCTGSDPRNHIERGRDTHKAISMIFYDSKEGHGIGWKEQPSQGNRKWWKNKFHRRRRRYDRKVIEEQLGEAYASPFFIGEVV